MPGAAAAGAAGARSLRAAPGGGREPRSRDRAARFLDVAAAPRRASGTPADGGLPARVARGALEAGVDARPAASSSGAARHRACAACNRSTSRRTSRTTCCRRPTSPRWRTRSSCARRSSTTRCVELGLSLPDRLKVRGPHGKVALRRAFADALPPELAARGKTGLRPAARALVPRATCASWHATCCSTRRRAGSSAGRRSSGCSSEHDAGRVDHGHRLWCLLVLELWRRAWVDSPALVSRVDGRRSRVAARGRRRRRCPRWSRSLLERGEILESFTEKSDDFARDVRRTRDVRVHPGRSVGVHAAAVRLLPRAGLLDLRPPLARARARADRGRACDGDRSSTRSAAAASLAARRRCSPRPSRRCTRTSSGTTSTSTGRSSTSRSRPASCLRRSSPRSAARARVAALRRRVLPASRSSATPGSSSCRSCSARAPLASRLGRGAAARARRGARVAAARRRRALGRPEQGRGRLLRADDGRPRALEGEQPADATACSTHGKWIDDVPRIPGAPVQPGGGARALPASAASIDARRRVRADALLPRAALEFIARSSRREGEARGARGADGLGSARRRRRRAGRAADVRSTPRATGSAALHGRALRARASPGCWFAPRPLRRARAGAARVQHTRRGGLRRRDALPRGVGLPDRVPAPRLSRCERAAETCART